MKKILFLFTVLALFAACQKEVPMDDNRTVEIRISTGSLIAATRADMTDVSIKDVDILVFSNSETPSDHSDAKFLYSRYAWQKSGDIYNAILKVDNDLDIYFALNARSVISGANLTEGMSWTEVQQALKLTTPVNRAVDGIPMWGYRLNTSLSESVTNNFGVVKVLRAVASAEIDMTEAGNFKLIDASVERASNQGYLAYTVGTNITYSDSEVNTDKPQLNYQLKTPEVPAGTTTETQVFALANTDTLNKITHKLYFYENDGPNDPYTNGKKYTKVVVHGVWDNNTPNDESDDIEGYYPLAFRDRSFVEGSNPRVPIVRNTKFRFNITNVYGKGYDSREKAKDGVDMNMTYDVIEWNIWEYTDITWIGDMFLSVGRSRNENLVKEASLFRNATSTDEIGFTTNIALDKFTLGLSGSGTLDVLTEDEKNSGILARVRNEFYEVTMVKGPTTTVDGKSEYSGKLVFKALKNYAPANPESILTISSDLIKYKIKVVQHNATPEDWVDGGDQGVVVGG